jgi:hypothetical protein
MQNCNLISPPQAKKPSRKALCQEDNRLLRSSPNKLGGIPRNALGAKPLACKARKLIQRGQKMTLLAIQSQQTLMNRQA